MRDAARGPGKKPTMTTRFNPPPGWPTVPPGWEPPPGWQPDPSWPDPPAGWTLWQEDKTAREWHVIAARTVIAGGVIVFLGSLLPFMSSSEPDLYQINSTPQDTATFFGIVLAAIGAVMLAKSVRTKVISGIMTLIVAGVTELTLLGITIAGIAGIDVSDDFGGSVHVNLAPHIGIIISILGCAVAGIGAVISFRPR
jgi:hypothetical protein